MTRPEPPPKIGSREWHERVERDNGAEYVRLHNLDRDDRHTPAPDVYSFCDIHGWHRHLLGCPACGEQAA